MNRTSSGRTSRSYWLLVGVLIALGILTIFSLGLYFWFVAVALIVMSPFRSRPRVFRSGIALFLGFLFGYFMIAPWGCSQTFTSDLTTGEETLSPIVCTSPVGIEYSGAEPFEPSRTPALAVGGITAVVAAAGTWLLSASRNGNSN